MEKTSATRFAPASRSGVSITCCPHPPAKLAREYSQNIARGHSVEIVCQIKLLDHIYQAAQGSPLFPVGRASLGYSARSIRREVEVINGLYQTAIGDDFLA